MHEMLTSKTPVQRITEARINLGLPFFRVFFSCQVKLHVIRFDIHQLECTDKRIFIRIEDSRYKESSNGFL